MNSNLIEHFLNKEQVVVTDFSLLDDVNSDNITVTFNNIFKSNWAYEILKIGELSEIRGICIVVAVYLPGRVMTGIASGREEISELVNKALVKALMDYSPKVIKNTNTTEKPKAASEDKAPVSETNLDELENSIKDKSPKNEYGIRQDQISFINDFKIKHTIDSDEKFNHYIQTWSDNNIYEISTKKELILAGEKVVDDFIKWITIASDNDTMTNSIVSPI